MTLNLASKHTPQLINLEIPVCSRQPFKPYLRSLFMIYFVNILALISLIVVPLQANAIPMGVDPSHSSVEFQIKHLASNVTGRFESFSGSFDFDPKKPEASLKDVKITIAAKSINTSSVKRDEHLRNPDFFDVTKFEAITFVGKSVKKKGKNKFELSGDLTLRGVTKPATWDLEYLGSTENPFVKGEEVFSFTGKTKLNRKDFNMVWNKALDKGGYILGDEVTVTANIEANPADKPIEAAAK